MLAWAMSLTIAGAMGSEPGIQPDSTASPTAASRLDFRRLFTWFQPRRTPRTSPAKSANPPIPNQTNDRPSDGVLQLRVQNEVFNDRALRMSPMRVEVREGIAILRGEVDSVSLADEACRRAERTHGILGVRNELHLGQRESPDGSGQMLLSTPKSAAGTRGKLLRVNNSTDESITVVSRPKVLASGDDLPDVTTYTIRRPRPGSVVDGSGPIEQKSVVEPENPAEKIPRPKRPGLIRMSAPDAAIGSSVPIVPETTFVESATPDATRSPTSIRIANVINGMPEARGLKFSENHGQITLFGNVANHQILFQAVEQLNGLPGIHSVSVDRSRTTLGE